MQKSTTTFFWGASTSSHQVEGNTKNDWSEWEHANAERLAKVARENPPAGGWPDYALEKDPNPLQEENYVSGSACDHYNKFEEDFELAKKLGHSAHRISLEWSRIEPEEGVFDPGAIEHYRKVFASLKNNGLEPFVTVWHWTLPLWLKNKNGVLNKNFPVYFEKYAEKVTSEFKNDVKFWITINEPSVYAVNSYLKGIWPPQKKNPFSFWLCRSNLIKAHQKSYLKIKSAAPNISVGLSENIVYLESAGGLINNILKFLINRFWNHYLFQRVRLDFIGLNYYFHSRINYGLNKNKNVVVSDMGWEIYPEGIYRVIKDLARYDLPIYVTENGIADSRDVLREKFIKDHVAWIKRATEEGADVRGYFYWSLLDNFEWDKGFWPRFGLVEIDYKTMKREIRRSAFVYKEIIENWNKN